MDDTNPPMPPNASPRELLLSQMPRELRNRIYSYLIPSALEVKVEGYLIFNTEKFEVTGRGSYVEAVATAPWKQLANVKLVCKQIRDELSEEILNAKKTKATGLLVDTKKAEDTRYVGTFRTETIKFPNPRRDPAVLEGFAEVTFAMPFITWEHYPEHDDPFWSENGLPYRSDYYESVGGYDFWLGRFKYTKHISDQGATTWTLDGVKGDLLCDPEYSKIDVVAHESKLAAVKEQVVTKVVEKQDDDSPLERVISKLQAPFHLMAGTYLEDLKFDLVSGIDTFNKVEQYEKEGYRPSYYKVLCQLESRNDMPKRTDDAEICDSAVKATYYL